jgi:hypothetical protein
MHQISIYSSKILPEYEESVGVPLRLLKSMYGIALSEKNWCIELLEGLFAMGVEQSYIIHCLQNLPWWLSKFSTHYVDDMLYSGTFCTLLTQYENNLSSYFNFEKLGQARWYLPTSITQQTNYNITLDQIKYL